VVLARQSGAKYTESATAEIISESWAATVLPRRRTGAHKWSVGGVVVVAGSPQYAGAAALCCAGAGRSGAGIISAALPRSIAPVVVGLVPEAAVVILPEGESNSVAVRAAEAIGERLERSAALVIGPGLGDDAATAALLGTLFGFTKVRGSIGFGTTSSGPDTTSLEGTIAAAGKLVVVDADGLNWLAQQESWWERVPAELMVLTPHPGEMSRLVGGDAEEIVGDPEGTARDAAMRWRQTVVLKGGRTVVASADGTVRTVDTPPSLATAGSGDVLCGSIGGLLAQGLDGPDAAALAVYVGCRAADRMSAQYGTLGVVAGDLPQAIASELRVLEELGA
jgi:NAD(P)H-hydrate repair Nnr-like enzyme with NAD(P)H-hydrate dehydratase domain